MPEPCDGLAIVGAADGRIYAIGGYNRGSFGRVDVYSPTTATWTTAAGMSALRSYHAGTAGLDGRIYVIGGASTDRQTVSTVEAYSPAANTWMSVASMPDARNSLAAVTGSDGRIYAIGGLRDGQPVATVTAYGGQLGAKSERTVEAYSLTTKTWTALADANVPLYADGAAVGPDGRIYVLGLVLQVQAFAPPS